jgi:hypothetical protein
MSVGAVLMVLPRLEEPVVHRQVHVHDQHIGHHRRPAALTEGFRHRLAIERSPFFEQQPQRLVHADLSLLRCQVEDRQVLLDRAAAPPVLQDVVGHPEPAGGEHRVAVAVLLERPGLAHQPVDDVAVLDAVLPPAPEPRQGVDLAGAVPDVEGLGPDVNINSFADQTARQRVGVAADVDRAPRIDPRLDPTGHLQPAHGQRRQDGRFLGEPLLAVGVPPGHELAEEGLVRAATREVAAPPQHEGLVDGLLEPVMALLDVAVLIGLAWLDRLAFESVVRQQGLVPPGEHLGLRVGVDRRGQAVGAVPSGNPSQLPQSVLQPFAEALEALGEADRACLPVRVGEHEVVDQVVERLAGDGDAESAHVGEVTLGEPPWLVGLCEEHLPGRPFVGAPLLDPPLQGPQLDVGEAAWMAALQVEEQGLGLEPRVEPELIDEFGPDVLERVLPGPPGVRGLPLAGERVRVAVLACRLLVDPRLVRGGGQCVFGLDQLPQPPEQAIGDHPVAPASREPKWDSLPGVRGREF